MALIKEGGIPPENYTTPAGTLISYLQTNHLKHAK